MEKKTDGKQDEKLFFLKLSEILFREKYIKETEKMTTSTTKKMSLWDKIKKIFTK